MNTAENNTTPTTGVWGVLKQIVTINGFFGPGFFKDFSEGWKEGCAKAANVHRHFVDDDDDGVGNRTYTIGFQEPLDPYGAELNPWTDEIPY